MATIFSSFLFSYGVVDIRYSLLVSANKLCFVLIGFGMFPTLFCSVALRTEGTVYPHTCESWVKTTHVGILKWDQLGRPISILPLLHVFVYVAGHSNDAIGHTNSEARYHPYRHNHKPHTGVWEPIPGAVPWTGGPRSNIFLKVRKNTSFFPKNPHTDNPAPLRINAPITTRRHRSSTWRPEVIRLHVVDGKVKRQHVSVWPRWEQSDWLNAHLTWDGREIKRPQQGQQTD